MMMRLSLCRNLVLQILATFERNQNNRVFMLVLQILSLHHVILIIPEMVGATLESYIDWKVLPTDHSRGL